MKKWKIATIFGLCTASLTGLGFSTFIISQSSANVPNIQVGADNVYFIGEYLALDKTQGSEADAVDEIVLTEFGFLDEDEFVNDDVVSFYLSFDLKKYRNETKTNLIQFDVTLTNESTSTSLFGAIDSISLSYDSMHEYTSQVSATLSQTSTSIIGQFPSIDVTPMQSSALYLKLNFHFTVATADSFVQLYDDFQKDPLKLSLKIDLRSDVA